MMPVRYTFRTALDSGSRPLDATSDADALGLAREVARFIGADLVEVTKVETLFPGQEPDEPSTST